MLMRFGFGNFRSFRDAAVLDMEARRGKENRETLIETEKGKFIRAAAIFGANASGKSNVVKALSVAAATLKNSNLRQVDSTIPGVVPFAFGKGASDGESRFEFEFVADGMRQIYGFSCTAEKIVDEYFLVYRSRKPSTVFERKGEVYEFKDKASRKILMPLVKRNNPNKNFLATATAWGAEVTRSAYLFLTSGIGVYDARQLTNSFLEPYAEDDDGALREFVLKLLEDADIDIVDYSVDAIETGTSGHMALLGMSGSGLRNTYYRVRTKHLVGPKGDFDDVWKDDAGGVSVGASVASERAGKYSASDGGAAVEESGAFDLLLEDESQGVQELFKLAPIIKDALDKGTVLCVDELGSGLHPDLLVHLWWLFNTPNNNPNGAQLVLTTHETELLYSLYMRPDQFYMVEKDSLEKTSQLYSLADFTDCTGRNMRDLYMAGKLGAVPNIM